MPGLQMLLMMGKNKVDYIIALPASTVMLLYVLVICCIEQGKVPYNLSIHSLCFSILL